jgi:glycine betaine/proline transport system permease protein
MLFLVGEFTALIAIVMYALVPAIRYVELGIRSVPPAAVEAARAFGATRGQLLRQVQLPLALPEIMLALNQTIMMALAMVIVASLVGVAAGLAVAFVAIITDRIIQSWSLRRKRAYGLA